MRNIFLRVVTLAALSFGALAGCAGPEAPADVSIQGKAAAPAPALPNAVVFGEFVIHNSPRNHTFTIERVSKPRAYGPGLEPQSLDELPVVIDGTSGSGPANTVELVTNSTSDPYPSPKTFSANVTLNQFYARSFANVYVQVTAITDTSGNPLSNHQAINSDDSNFGLSNALGLWQYTADASTSPGVLAQAPNNGGTRDWVFNNPDDADDNISLVVYGSLGFGSYTFGFPNSSYIDACSGGTSSTSNGQITPAGGLPFDFTLYNTNTSTVKIAAKNGQVAFGSTALTASGVPLSLPDNAAPHPILFAFWDNLKYGVGGKVCYKSVGSAPNRQFVIEWRTMDFASGVGVGSKLDFEAILFEGTSEIDVVYNTMVGTGTSAGRENGALAWVGIQDETATNAVGEFKAQDFGTSAGWSFVPAPF